MGSGFLSLVGTKTSIAGIEVDVTHNVEHSYPVEATDRPVLVGANITDHARVKPNEISIKGKFSNMRDALEPILWGDKGPAEDDAQALITARDTSEIVQVVTPFDSADNMLITELTITRDAQTGDAVEFSAKLKQIIMVTTALTTVATKISRAKMSKSKGESPVTTLTTTGPFDAKANEAHRAFVFGKTGQYPAAPLL
jgi:hypothetical protein